jgi:hypothetical protein
MSEFDDIRPYNDSEVSAVLHGVVRDPELLDLVGILRFGKLYRWFGWFFRPLLTFSFASRVKQISSVMDFQLLMEKYLDKSISETTDGLFVKGLEQLELDQPHLFISNHRDITLDPAFTNYALHHNGGDTLRIAIGDNLLSKPFASDLMRLNKSFIVRRSITQPRKLLAALKTLSRYIWHSLHEDRSNIWIAHREGRAKDGWDKTDSAIIKMLGIAKPKHESFSDYIRSLRIVPVSISYEYDPCDGDKSKELAILAEGQSYTKEQHEDLESIGKGIRGYKGRVNLVFGQPLQEGLDDYESVAQALDYSIVMGYELYGSNSYAYFKLFGSSDWNRAKNVLTRHGTELPEFTEDEKTQIEQRLIDLNDAEKNILLLMYANPIVHKLQFIENTEVL